MRHSDRAVDSIYEPIQSELAQVEENLKVLSVEGPSHLRDLLGYVLPTQGKRIRPAVGILASRFGTTPPEGLSVKMATAVELLHIASLIHDDTVDNSPLRRGIATVSSVWGRDVAVLLGDYVFATAAIWACETDNTRLLRRFSETIMDLSSGELMELFSAFDPSHTYEQYQERINKKTATLFRTAAESGAVLGDVSESWVQALVDYANNLGMAFQIVDDILDFEGSQEEIGKPVGSDLLQGTLTLPAILLMQRYPQDNPIINLFRGEEPEANSMRAVEMIQESSIIAESYAIANKFSDDAIQALQCLPDIRERRSLLELVSYVTERRR